MSTADAENGMRTAVVVVIPVNCGNCSAKPQQYTAPSELVTHPTEFPYTDSIFSSDSPIDNEGRAME
jgi:hypothetical protein